ncbi:hypothetical protein BO71DRAFT_173825 [Aspergillus ellipticus CBS 707.79]|uniref:Uncharacterized protein n=1 Tax=Aspergillus ellipticus CBS 707.79 TaxID=1448320 RepID=A0A319DYJ8_9EURO|nr:hypothetical protein BO71DRAFT_173825 [Aspergillus ellipticus CBS 707.79]
MQRILLQSVAKYSYCRKRQHLGHRTHCVASPSTESMNISYVLAVNKALWVEPLPSKLNFEHFKGYMRCHVQLYRHPNIPKSRFRQKSSMSRSRLSAGCSRACSLPYEAVLGYHPRIILCATLLSFNGLRLIYFDIEIQNITLETVRRMVTCRQLTV